MSSISTFLDQRRLTDLASDPDYLPRPGTGTGPREFAPAADNQPAYRAAVNAGADIAFAALRCAQAAHPGLMRRHNDLATARMPCVSDADPAAGDMPESIGDMLEQITEARACLDMAMEMLLSGNPACELSARSCFNEAIEFLEVSE